jgi:hypothetical protein
MSTTIQRPPRVPRSFAATAWLPALLFFTALLGLTGCAGESVAQARAAGSNGNRPVASSASQTPLPGPGDAVHIYNPHKGTWENGLLRDVPAGVDFIHSNRLMRLRGAGGAIQWVRDIDISKLADADSAYDPEAEQRFPEDHDVVYITGKDGYHALLAQVPPGRKVAFQGRIYETRAGASPGELQIRYSGLTINRVTNTFRRRTDTLVVLTIRHTENGNEDTISGTPEHPFFVPAINDYVAMGKLTPGTVLRTTDGSKATVVTSTTRHGDFEVFNLEVEHAHNYFVSAPGSDGPGVLVHNECKFPDAKELSKRLGGRDVHDAKSEILKDLTAKDSPWRDQVKKLGTNPDIGVTEAGNVALKSRNGGAVLETDIPLSTFGAL